MDAYKPLCLTGSKLRLGAGFSARGPSEIRNRMFAYLSGVCSPEERNARGDRQTLGLPTRERSLIRRADGMPIGIETA
jgi:hypothetical protein